MEKDEKTKVEEIAEDDQMVVEILNKFFSNVITKLDLMSLSQLTWVSNFCSNHGTIIRTGME